MANLKLYIKRYGIFILLITLILIVNSSINPLIEGDSFESKKTNKNYRVEVAKVMSDELREISGIAYSSLSGLFWIHNDSGNSSDIYALDETGKIRIKVILKDTKNIDFEDISIRNYEGKSIIYIADVGNNKLDREEMFIYKFREPELDKEKHKNQSDSDHADYIEVIIEPKILSLDTKDLDINFESIIVENKSEKIFLIEKSKSKEASIYFISDFESDEHTNMLSYYGKIDFAIYGKQEVVAADISSDDKYILLKTKTDIFSIDRKDFKKESTYESLSKLPYVEEYQGEASSWGKNAIGYYTVSESKKDKASTIYYYRNVYK